MIRVFKSSAIIDALLSEELEQLVKDFKDYKDGRLPDLFGRDELYDHPHNLNIIKAEELRHIHLSSSDKPFHVKKLQFNRTSDKHLVYCQGVSHTECYLLMAILGPNPRAHDQANSNNIMYQLGTMAEKFRSKF